MQLYKKLVQQYTVYKTACAELYRITGTDTKSVQNITRLPHQTILSQSHFHLHLMNTPQQYDGPK